ncbi:MAG: hypothetical protein ABSG13_24360 [Bryobacteraceae bacterium]
MAHVGQELALGVAGGFGRLLGVQQLRFGLFARRNVHSVRNDIADIALAVAERSQSHVDDQFAYTADERPGFKPNHLTSSRAGHHFLQQILLFRALPPAFGFPKKLSKDVRGLNAGIFQSAVIAFDQFTV